MKNLLNRCARSAAVMLAATLSCSALASGGITLGSTRIIYSADEKQSSVHVRNTSDKSSYLVQSWVEDAAGNKTKDFVVTPPLYKSAPKNENILRLIFAAGQPPQDRETLYYFNAKGIPLIDKKEIEGQNALVLATVTKIKLFVRPKGLDIKPEDASKSIYFTVKNGKVFAVNPTPYYITMTDIKSAGKSVPGVMISPKSEMGLSLSSNSGSVTFKTINDYGGMTKEQSAVFK